MIFPAGNRKNLETRFNPLTDNPRSPSYEPELKKNVKKANRDWAQPTQASKLDASQKNMLGRGSTIGSARAGGLSDVGGPVRQMHTATNNSIWDPKIQETIRKTETTGESLHRKNAEADAAVKQIRQSDRNFHINKDEIIKGVREHGMPSAHSVSANSAHATDSSNYGTKVPSHQISIFDQQAFERLPAKTAGEAIHDAAKARQTKKDRSWAQPTVAASTKQQLSALFHQGKDK